jgi:hypothetical protein
LEPEFIFLLLNKRNLNKTKFRKLTRESVRISNFALTKTWFNYFVEKNTQKSEHLEQGWPRRGPRAIFGPPLLLEWPSKDDFYQNTCYKTDFSHVNAAFWPSKSF